MATLHEWSCVEAGCDYVVLGADEDTVVAAAMDHVRLAHGSFELEEMILAALARREETAVPADFVAVGAIRVAPRWASQHEAEQPSAERKRAMEWSPTRGYTEL